MSKDGKKNEKLVLDVNSHEEEISVALDKVINDDAEVIFQENGKDVGIALSYSKWQKLVEDYTAAVDEIKKTQKK